MQPMRMADFANMDFNRARDSLHQDPGPSFAQTLTRTMSAPTVMSVPGGNPLSLMMARHLLPHAFEGLGIFGGPLVSRDELQTMLLNASQPQWTPASEEDIGDLPVVSIEARHLANADTKLCSVCQEDFTLGERATILTCNHLFHQKCITPWLEKNRTCPLCRKEVVNVRWEQLQRHGQRALRQPPAPSASARRRPEGYRGAPWNYISSDSYRMPTHAIPQQVGGRHPLVSTVRPDRVHGVPVAQYPAHQIYADGTQHFPRFTGVPEPVYRTSSHPGPRRDAY
eukprot:TRINITY_DN5020_c0_g1_i2.p1 TRINITY_DN5020_c0_g1~~TRINITY_DN5020_c0_g1_i2.p1  ORF type:complete len:290 (-),score=34.21 TRINITY_DN5020_c0_g1_i2:302-1150(-)